MINCDGFKQKNGIPMGSPLSGALACIFLKTLECGAFKSIIPKNSVYLRYIDDVLLIHPRRTEIPNLTLQLNKIEPTIQFTFEEETNQELAFLDVKIHRTDTELEFSVHRK